jgi:hypothetical protein
MEDGWESPGGKWPFILSSLLKCPFSQKWLRYLCRTLRTLTYRYDVVVRCAHVCSQYLSQIGTLFESAKSCEIVIRHLSILLVFPGDDTVSISIPLLNPPRPMGLHRLYPTLSRRALPLLPFSRHKSLSRYKSFLSSLFSDPGSRRSATSNMSRLTFKKPAI